MEPDVLFENKKEGSDYEFRFYVDGTAKYTTNGYKLDVDFTWNMGKLNQEETKKLYETMKKYYEGEG